MVLRNEELLLAVLNSAPVIDGVATDALDENRGGGALARSWGGSGSSTELARLRRVRSALHAVIRGEENATDGELARALDAVTQTPRVTSNGVRWDLRVSDDDRLAVETVLAWSRVMTDLPGRLRPCANEECNLFLVDHSRPGTAKWCSMATCGNRMKVRAYARRAATG
ncbi:CGNR zinc finger domain-containing protein [Microbacterium sp. ABRD28]|uniref:CGNR zinc finger domain-containing protein n=1 Tax=Microbacterium sp. ABRD28 TaxID=2268461 RepID=UPI000F5585E6|nr:CGNR zinc finger domain-containing protein [Microbacterium sp. ABRD28]AZC12969.1 CGNR zinc finger domain-containing protein [Microbacterium sp. ABRD28]